MANDAGDPTTPAALDSDVERPHSVGTAQNGDGTGPISRIREEEVVFVLRAPREADSGYLIYSVVESATSDGGKPFGLSVVHAPQLSEDSPVLKDLLFDQDAIPPAHLTLPRQVHVVVSTRSGLRLAPDFYEAVLRPLLKAVGLESTDVDGNDGDGYRVTVTKSPNTIRDFAREIGRDDKAGEKTIILLSGDGGLVDLLNGLDHTSSPSNTPSPPTIALLPLGTGNALFHSLHKPHYSTLNPTPSPLVLGLRTLFRGTPSPLPTFKASFSPGAKLISAPVDHPEHATSKDHEKETPITHLVGAIVASYGFHASLVWESDTPSYRVHGDKRFGMAAAELLKVAHGYDATVEIRRVGTEKFTQLSPQHSEGKGGEGKFNYVLTTLVSNLEKTFAISPASRPLDGRLRLVHFGDVGGDRTMEIMMAAYREGEHVRMGEVGYDEVEEVKVTIAEEDARWRKVCVDGSIVEVERGGWMTVQREEGERVRVLVG